MDPHFPAALSPVQFPPTHTLKRGRHGGRYYCEPHLGSPFPLPWLRTPAGHRVSFESAGSTPFKRQWGCAGNNSHSVCENSRAPGLRRAFTTVRESLGVVSQHTRSFGSQSLACP